MKKKYTIALPVHNGGHHLHLCIDSILSQTYTNFDLVVLENSSTDGTPDYLSTINDDRVHIYPSDKLLPIEENWERILSIPKNEFISIVGHDDLLDTDYLEIMDEFIQHHPDAALYQSHFRFIDNDGTLIRSCSPMPEKGYAHDFLSARLNSRYDTSTGFIMRSSDYDKIGGMPKYKNLLFADDSLFIKLMKISYKATTKKESFSYRFHTGSISGKPDQMALLDAALAHITFLTELRKDDEQISNVLDRHSATYFAGFCREKYFSILISANRNNKRINEYSDVISKIEKLLGLLNLDFNIINNSFPIKIMEFINKLSFRKIMFYILVNFPLKVLLFLGNTLKISNKPLQALNRLDI